MTPYFPITSPLNKDAEIIIDALTIRSEQVKANANSQNIIKKIFMVAIKVLGMAAGIVTVACIPVAAILFTAAPLKLGFANLSLAISCLALSLLLDPRSAGEGIIKDYWKSLCEALRNGNGKKIIETCQELAKQQESRADSFKNALGSLSITEINPFFHKTCLVGYLQIAMEHLKHGEEEQAKSNAHLALSHFDASGFSPEIEKFVRSITESPGKMRQFIQAHDAGNSLHALDSYVAISTEKTSW